MGPAPELAQSETTLATSSAGLRGLLLSCHPDWEAAEMSGGVGGDRGRAWRGWEEGVKGKGLG